MTTGSEMLRQRTRFLVDVHLDLVDSAVTHIGNWKVNGAISAEERKSSDRAIVLHSLHTNVMSGKINNT